MELKVAKKERQRKRRAATLEQKRLSDERFEDRYFAATLRHDLKRGQLNAPSPPPHCEWDGTDFVPTRPKPSPKLDVNITVMHAAHEKFGVRWSGSRKGIYKPRVAEAVADSGCQTCSAGIDVLEKIGCPLEYLVPTSHRIVGITDSLLDIAGAALLRIEVGGQVTRQMVHISKNTRGLYLSETALGELGLLPQDFPKSSESGSSEKQASSGPSSSKIAAACTEDASTPCIKRTPAPKCSLSPQRKKTCLSLKSGSYSSSRPAGSTHVLTNRSKE